MNALSGLKRYQKLFLALSVVVVLIATGLYTMADKRNPHNKASLLISEMEVSLLQCRRAEKNFLMRHDRASVESFARWVGTLRKHESTLRSATKDTAIRGLLDTIHAEIPSYENAFQDMKGLYDSANFGPVRDQALSNITDEVTLMAEPTVTPSSVDTTRSVIEAARNLEYYIQLFPKGSAGLIATLNLRRWEKNLQKGYDKSAHTTDSKVLFYRRKTSHEISKLKSWIEAKDEKGKNASSIAPLKLALRQYELNFNQLIANQDASYVKKRAMINSARLIENTIKMLKSFLTQDKNDIPTMISQVEIALLQCRRAEKNFLMRHDRPSADGFAKGILDLKKQEAAMRSVTEDKAIVGFLDDINAEVANYENAFEDIKGLYDSATFGPVRDRALSKITDEVTLMAEPTVTPSSVDTTGSVIEAARNLEYYVSIVPENSVPMISILQARRWEKNFQERYDRLTGGVDSRSIFCIRKIEQEVSKLKEWLGSKKVNARSSAEFAPLKSALDRYELNLMQLARNVDAFYVKKKELVGSARRLDRSVQMIKEKVFKSRAETDINGVYYLSSKLPVHGQPEGNYHDVGSLVRNQPARYGYRHCKNWVQFYFDHDGRYTKSNLISSIYFHIWIRTVNNSIDMGYEKGGKYSGGPGAMDEFISMSYDASKGHSSKNGCSLITGKIDLNCLFKGEEIYNFAIKLSRHAGYPSVVIEPNQYSFIIINPACDSVLKSTDSDSDGLKDYEEMFAYNTNPYDEDTDGDGFSDRIEVVKETSPNINDLYSGRVIDVISDTPHIEHSKDIHGDWIVDKKERYVNSKFTLRGNLTIRNGGSLSLDNCIVHMNRGAKNKHIYLDKGGTLNLRKTHIDFNETGYWYKVVEGDQVEIASNFYVHGTLKMKESVLQNGLGIKVHQGSRTEICDSGILNCYHLSYEGESASTMQRSVVSTFIGIPLYCKLSSPTVRDTMLSVEYGGVGIYCFDSSPSISNSKVFVCEDEDSDSAAFILVENSHPVLSSTQFNTKRVRRDKSSSIVFE